MSKSSNTDAVALQQGIFARGVELSKAGRNQEALECFAACLNEAKSEPLRALCFNDIGRLFSQTGQLDTAIRFFLRSLERWPGSPDVLANLALCHKWKGDLKTAKRFAARALEKNPWHNQCQFTAAMIDLLAGDYENGFEAYECRWRDAKSSLRKIVSNTPEWDGENGTKVYIYGEQGSDDSILMLRYAKRIRERGLKQAWVTQKGMKPLLGLIDEIDEVVDVGDALPEFDCHIPAASLPRVFKTTLATIPAAPYITRPEATQYGPGFHIGIVWRGSAIQQNDFIRSTRLEQWLPVLSVPGVTFHSLQVENAQEAIFYNLVEEAPPINWRETAMRVCGLNLVISVDTSVVHLCGALGVPCWVALHSRPYFVYPPHLDFCPWYPSLRLFKQRQNLDWRPVFEDIAKELQCLVQS